MLHDFFENESIYWLDDIDLICSMVLKTIKSIEPTDEPTKPILALYKDFDDEKDKAMQNIMKKVNSKISQTAANKHLQCVLPKSSVAYVKPGTPDITEDVRS